MIITGNMIIFVKYDHLRGRKHETEAKFRHKMPKMIIIAEDDH